MAEVYWDLEWTMRAQGFDYAYDKRLYMTASAQVIPQPVHEHFHAWLRLPDEGSWNKSREQARCSPGSP